MTALLSPPSASTRPVAPAVRPRQATPGRRPSDQRASNQPASNQPAQGRIRLTRRGRWVVGGLLLLLVVVGFSIGRATASSAAGLHTPATTRVEPGQTLWTIATKAAPNRDPRNEIADIARLNHLHGDDISDGQVLVLP